MNIKNNYQNNFIENEHFQKYVLIGNKEDVTYWENWLQENPEKEDGFLEAKKILTSFKIKSIKVSPEQYETDLKKLKVSIENKRSASPVYLKVNFNAIFRYAAIILISAGVGFSVFKFTDKKLENVSTSRIYEKSNPKGEKSIIMLPDGSKVYLNAASSLKYESDPITGDRNIYLNGEAFFDVAKNEHRPFNVYSNGVRTTALGTSFNVNAYDDEEHIKVYLKTGKIEVQNNETLFYLVPGEGVSFDIKTNKLARVEMESKKALAWKSEVISFDNESLGEVTRKLEKWYGVTINVEGTPKSKWHLNGEFENENIENILKSLSFITPFNYGIDDETITLKF